MKQDTKKQIIDRWRESSYRQGAPSMIAKELDMSRDRVKRVIDAHRNEKTAQVVSYRVMKRTRQGLRLVRVKCGKSSMDWYTDRDDKGIQAFVEGIRERMAGELT